MKLHYLSSLLLFILFSGPLFAQFDGHNGQSTFYAEVEEDNRPSFLQVEEENLLIERWQEALNHLGLQNVATLEEIKLEEMQSLIQTEWSETSNKNEHIQHYIHQLETRNEHLLKLQVSLAAIMIDLEEENRLYQHMGSEISDAEEMVQNENNSEIAALTSELNNYQSELQRNQDVLVEQINLLLQTELQLSTLSDEKEAMLILAQNLSDVNNWMQYAHAK